MKRPSRIQSMAAGMNLYKAWDLADKIDNVLEESIEYAFDEARLFNFLPD